jgi:hypothetical protein
MCVVETAATDGGGPTEGGAEGGAFDTDGGTMLFEDDFEGGCGRWFAYMSTATSDPAAHTGALSCRVCGTPGNPPSMGVKHVLASPPLGRYHARAWLRVPTGAPAVQDAGIFLRTHNEPGGGFVQVQIQAAGPPSLADTWQQVDVELLVNTTAAYLDLTVYGPKGACLLVDDAYVEKLP